MKIRAIVSTLPSIISKKEDSVKQDYKAIYYMGNSSSTCSFEKIEKQIEIMPGSKGTVVLNIDKPKSFSGLKQGLTFDMQVNGRKFASGIIIEIL